MAKKDPSKLYLEDVVKLIRNLQSGEYNKGKSLLVSKDGKNFCCLGVWADQHGCVWATNRSKQLIPFLPRMKKPAEFQGVAVLDDPISFGLTGDVQGRLTGLNDNTDGWDAVITYLKNEVLPKAE